MGLNLSKIYGTLFSINVQKLTVRFANKYFALNASLIKVMHQGFKTRRYQFVTTA